MEMKLNHFNMSEVVAFNIDLLSTLYVEYSTLVLNHFNLT